MKQRIGGAAGREQVQQRDPAVDDLADQPALRRRRSAEGERHPVGGGGDARLPRCCPARRAEQWIAELERRLADPTIKIEVINDGEDPACQPQDTPLYRALESAIKRHHPDAIVTPMTVPYGTDANGFRPHGVKSYGIFPGIIPAASILSMHGDAEFMPVDALGPAIQILFDALRDTASR